MRIVLILAIFLPGLVKSPKTDLTQVTQPSQQSSKQDSSISVYIPEDEMDFTNICQTEKIITVGSWYEDWVGRSLLDRSADSMLYGGTEIYNQLEKHISHVEKYVKILKTLNEKTVHYSTRYLTLSVSTVLNNANDFLSKAVKLSLHDAAVAEDKHFENKVHRQMTEVLIPYVGEYFYKELELATSGKLEQSRINDRFKTVSASHFEEAKQLSVEACKVLLKTVEFFAKLKPEAYALDDKKKNPAEYERQAYLYHYYKSFSFVLTKFKPAKCEVEKLPSSVRGIFSQTLLGSNIETNLKTRFFTSQLFALIQTNLQDLDYILEFDKFILVGLTSYDSLHSVISITNRKISFTVEFINDFPNLDSSIKHDETATRENKHEFEVYFILYRLYVLLRTSQFGQITGTVAVGDVYTRILNFILTTDHFDSLNTNVSNMSVYSLENIDPKVPNPTKFAENFISKQSFIIHFPALITLLLKKTNLKFTDKKTLIEKKIKELILLIDYSTQGFKEEAIDPEILKLVEENIKVNTLGNLSKELIGMNFQKTIDKCKSENKKEVVSDNFTVVCTKEFVADWMVIFNKYFGKLTMKDNAGEYVEQLKSSVKSISVASHRSLMFYAITVYFRSLSLNKFSTLKVYEIKMCEAYSQEALGIMMSQIDPSSTEGFANFLKGASNKQLFGKYLRLETPQEMDFHGFNIFFVLIYSRVMKAKSLMGSPATKKQAEELQKEILDIRNYFNTLYIKFEAERTKDLKDKPFKYIKLALKNEFVVKFIDFFDLYYLRFDTTESMSLPIYSNQFISVHSIFVNFYHFLFHVRETLSGPIESPYEFLLNRLEECLVYSGRPSSQPKDQVKEQLCRFSNRKYSEMFYFYKFYLVLKGKVTRLPIASSNADHMNTHTRMFFIYAKNNKDFENAINVACEGLENKSNDFCAAYSIFDTFYQTVMDSSRRGTTFEFVREYFAPRLDQAGKNSKLRLNILFASEAIAMLVNGNGVNYGRYTALFGIENSYYAVDKQFSNDFVQDKKVLDLFKVESGDAESRTLLVHYLKNTYKKTSISDNEIAMSQCIQSIMNENIGPQNNVLDSFFSYGGNYVFAYVKIFLMFSSEDSHFEKITDYLIKHQVFIDLANLNKPNDDPVFAEMINRLALKDNNFVAKKRDPKAKGDLPHDVAVYRMELYTDLEAKYKLMMEETSRKLGDMLQLGSQSTVEEDDGPSLFDDILNETQEEEKAGEKEVLAFQTSEKSKKLMKVTVKLDIEITEGEPDTLALSYGKDVVLKKSVSSFEFHRIVEVDDIDGQEEQTIITSEKAILLHMLQNVIHKEHIPQDRLPANFNDWDPSTVSKDEIMEAIVGLSEFFREEDFRDEPKKSSLIQIRRDLEAIMNEGQYSLEDGVKTINSDTIRNRKQKRFDRASSFKADEKI